MRRSGAPLTNADVARRLVELGRVLEEQGGNPFKVRAYRRAAARVAGLRRSVVAEFRTGGDLTRYHDIGPGIVAALRWIVNGGQWGQLEMPLVVESEQLRGRTGGLRRVT